ncbi:hypothetical protein KPP10_gp114 [Pseudomonas phage KPP10]|uniref:Uncharacterized protein n=1 Tax=Pseudomonas phage KPP10 TaxID=582345 RepID=D6RRR3_BPKPP|nr:hypothetical protein KPP10_gp114 [Pseudomonas phage KPP10]BAJ09081.1 hypothetical protein [Pseudomonas phage KPP10]
MRLKRIEHINFEKFSWQTQVALKELARWVFKDMGPWTEGKTHPAFYRGYRVCTNLRLWELHYGWGDKHGRTIQTELSEEFVRVGLDRDLPFEGRLSDDGIFVLDEDAVEELYDNPLRQRFLRLALEKLSAPKVEVSEMVEDALTAVARWAILKESFSCFEPRFRICWNVENYLTWLGKSEVEVAKAYQELSKVFGVMYPFESEEGFDTEEEIWKNDRRLSFLAQFI